MEKYYVLERFALMKTAVISTLDSMRLKRKGIEKNQKNNNIKNARKLYKELESARKRLSDNILNLKLLFCEADMKECGIYAEIVTGRLGVVLIFLLFYVLLRNCNKKIR